MARDPLPDLYGAEIQFAADEALEVAIREGWARDEGTSPGGMRRGSIVEDDATFRRWADLVCSMIRPPFAAYRFGGAKEECGIAGDVPSAEPVCLGYPSTRENFDMAQSAGGGKAWIGGQQFHLAARGFAPGTDCIESPVPVVEVVCPGFGQPPNWDWFERRSANFATDHWVPVDSHDASMPGFGHDVQVVGGEYRWAREGRHGSPWYATNPGVQSGFLTQSRVRHADGLRCNRAGVCRFDDHFRYYPPCPSQGLVEPDEPEARVR